MCLTAKSDKKQIAEQPITVYKILDKNLKSPFQSYKYELGKEYTNDSVEDIGEAFEHYLIGSGFFHAYDNLNRALKECALMNRNKKYEFNVYEAEIPKDAFYIKGVREDICSKTLKIIKKCTI